MANYKMLGGGIITATTPNEFIEKLRALSFNPCESLEDFIEQTAKACLLQTGKYVAPGPAVEFLNELIEMGFVDKIEEVQDYPDVTTEGGITHVTDGDKFFTYKSSMPEIKTWQDVIDEVEEI